MKKLMIYGAAGYTGGMAAQHAAEAGIGLVLAGRPQHRAALETIARRLNAMVRIFCLDEPEVISDHFEDIAVLLNSAGPFVNTAEPLMRAAIHCGVHYLDFSAELSTYQQALSLDASARAAGVMLLPGSGGSVAMLGSLAGHAVARVRHPRKIHIALNVVGSMSRGSAVSASLSMVSQTLHLVDGQLVIRNPEEVRDFDFGYGPESSFPVTLPDLLTLYESTGVRDIETFVHVTSGALPTENILKLPSGPGTKERLASRYHAAVEVTDADGTVVHSILDTVNGYTFTAMAAVEASRRVLNGEIKPGFQTPGGLFGFGFAETIADTRIIDMPSFMASDQR